MIIFCPKHGLFKQLPSNHVRGHGCRLCGAEESGSQQRFSTRRVCSQGSHSSRQSLQLLRICLCRKWAKKIIIVCRKISTLPANCRWSFSGQGCPKCAGTQKSTTEEFIQKARRIHGNRYDYSRSVYVGWRQHVVIVCPRHGPFLQSPGHHIRGQECHLCAKEWTSSAQRLSKESLFVKPGLFMVIGMTIQGLCISTACGIPS